MLGCSVAASDRDLSGGWLAYLRLSPYRSGPRSHPYPRRYCVVTERAGLPHPSLRWARVRPICKTGSGLQLARASAAGYVHLGGFGGKQK